MTTLFYIHTEIIFFHHLYIDSDSAKQRWSKLLAQIKAVAPTGPISSYSILHATRSFNKTTKPVLRMSLMKQLLHLDPEYLLLFFLIL